MAPSLSLLALNEMAAAAEFRSTAPPPLTAPKSLLSTTPPKTDLVHEKEILRQKVSEEEWQEKHEKEILRQRVSQEWQERQESFPPDQQWNSQNRSISREDRTEQPDRPEPSVPVKVSRKMKMDNSVLWPISAC